MHVLVCRLICSNALIYSRLIDQCIYQSFSSLTPTYVHDYLYVSTLIPATRFPAPIANFACGIEIWLEWEFLVWLPPLFWIWVYPKVHTLLPRLHTSLQAQCLFYSVQFIYAVRCVIIIFFSLLCCNYSTYVF